MKVAINKCYGGFSLSDKASMECIKRGMTCQNSLTEPELHDTDFYYHPPKEDYPIEQRDKLWYNFGARYFLNNCDEAATRCHPTIIAVIEEMGEEANGECAEITIIDIPDDLELDDILVCDQNGMEWVAEKHRSWS